MYSHDVPQVYKVSKHVTNKETAIELSFIDFDGL